MHLDQHIEVEGLGGRRQLGQLRIGQRRDYQQHAIGAQGAGLDDLVGVDHEILADHRQRTGVARLLQVEVGALEEILVGQHRQTGRTTGLVTAGDVRRDEQLTQHALARRSLLDLGDHRRLLAFGLFLQGPGETTRGIGGTGLLLDFREADDGATLGHFFGLAGEDLLQNGWNAHP
ncbi:hypothetical protein D3C86_1545370 [compost metagenome]